MSSISYSPFLGRLAIGKITQGQIKINQEILAATPEEKLFTARATKLYHFKANEQVEVNEIDGSQTTVLEVTVAKSDIGKVIGKKGRNVQAIRTILNAVSGKSRKHHVLEIVD